MNPASTQSHQTDCRMMHVQDLAQLDVGQVTLLDKAHTIFSEARVPYSFAPNLSSTFDHLSEIFHVCPEMKMGRLDTDRSVAGMQNIQPIRRTVMNFIRQNMSTECAAMGTNLPVSAATSASRPIPTSVRRITGHEPGEDFGVSESSRASTTRSVGHPISVLRRGPR